MRRLGRRCASTMPTSRWLRRANLPRRRLRPHERVADRAHEQAQAIADEAEQRAVCSADRRLKAAHGTEDALATTAAGAVRDEQTTGAPEKAHRLHEGGTSRHRAATGDRRCFTNAESQLVRAIRTASRAKTRLEPRPDRSTT